MKKVIKLKDGMDGSSVFVVVKEVVAVSAFFDEDLNRYVTQLSLSSGHMLKVIQMPEEVVEILGWKYE